MSGSTRRELDAGSAPPLEFDPSDGGSGPPWGFHVMGFKPFVYLFEVTMGTWHWVGRLDEVTYSQYTAPIIRSACGLSFRSLSHYAEDPFGLLDIYLSTTPHVEQQNCVACRLPQDEAPPTLYLGDKRLGLDKEPVDRRRKAE